MSTDKIRGNHHFETAEYGEARSGLLLVQPVGVHDLSGIESEVSAIRQLTGRDFRLVTVKVHSWNQDLSPWPSPAVFGKEGFGDGAGDTLAAILPLVGNSKKVIIGGYSLAGLFALWAGYQSDLFSGIAAASPSVWFPGFSGYMKQHEMKSPCVYLSLGDLEEKTRNPVMSRVGDCIREAYTLLDLQGINCFLEWNKGNHFREPDLRTAKAFAWAIQHTG